MKSISKAKPLKMRNPKGMTLKVISFNICISIVNVLALKGAIKECSFKSGP